MKILKFNEDVIIDSDYRLGDISKYKKLTNNQFKNIIYSYFNINDIIKEYLITYIEDYDDTEINFKKHDSYTIDMIEIVDSQLIIQITKYSGTNEEIVIGVDEFLKFYNHYDLSMSVKKYNL